jgi:adenine-specific DNA-methyltransferase
MTRPKTNSEPVAKRTATVNADKIELIGQLFPEAYTEGRIDWDKVRAAVGDVADERGRYSFSWAGKSEAIRALQIPSRATLIPDKRESVNFETTEHLFIEGDNLEVLKLLYKPYFGRVKLIYIDPPYNTGSDFIYPDNYGDPLDTYLKVTGQKDGNGNLLTSNPETSGRYHSSWLSMMYPRLFLARQLLKDDGAIFISIDDHEVHNLRMLMNEIFGEENFIASIVWQKKYSPQNDATYFSDMHDYILVYAKKAKETKNDASGWTRNLLARTEEQTKRYKNLDNDPRGHWKPSGLDVKTYAKEYDYPITTPSGRVVNPPKGKCWRYPKARFEELVKDNRIWFGETGNNVPAIKRFLDEVQSGIVPTTWWKREDSGDNQEATQELNALMHDVDVTFDNPKPVRLIKRILGVATNAGDGDIVLDFFAGSCTTAHAVLETNQEDGGNRRFMMVQLPHPTMSEKFPTIAAIGRERIRRAIKKLQDGTQDALVDFGFKAFKLAPSNYKQWNVPSQQNGGVTDPESYAEQLEIFTDTLIEEWDAENVIYEVAIKEGYGLNSQIEKVEGIKGNTIYKVAGADKQQSFYICLDTAIRLKDLKPLELMRDDLLICRDSAIDDEAAANLALQCRLKTL